MIGEHKGEQEPKAEVHAMALVREALLCWRYSTPHFQAPASTRCCLTSFTAELLVGYLEHSHGPKRDISLASLA